MEIRRLEESRCIHSVLTNEHYRLNEFEIYKIHHLHEKFNGSLLKYGLTFIHWQTKRELRTQSYES